MPKSAAHLKKHQFKKGAPSANPQGARLQDPAIRALKKLTIESYREIIELVLQENIEGLQEMIKHPATSALQVGIATCFLKALKNGDYSVVERIAERIIGKIPEELKVTSHNMNLNLNAKAPKEIVAALMKDVEDEV